MAYALTKESFMLKKVIDGYKKLFISIARMLILLTFCFVLAICVIFPLWKWATLSPLSYTWCVIGFIVLSLIYLIVKSFLHSDKKVFLYRLLKILIVLSGITAFIICLITGQRILSFIVLALFILIYGFLSFSTKNTRK